MTLNIKMDQEKKYEVGGVGFGGDELPRIRARKKGGDGFKFFEEKIVKADRKNQADFKGIICRPTAKITGG